MTYAEEYAGPTREHCWDLWRRLTSGENGQLPGPHARLFHERSALPIVGFFSVHELTDGLLLAVCSCRECRALRPAVLPADSLAVLEQFGLGPSDRP